MWYGLPEEKRTYDSAYFGISHSNGVVDEVLTCCVQSEVAEIIGHIIPGGRKISGDIPLLTACKHLLTQVECQPIVFSMLDNTILTCVVWEDNGKRDVFIHMVVNNLIWWVLRDAPRFPQSSNINNLVASSLDTSDDGELELVGDQARVSIGVRTISGCGLGA